MHFKYLIVSFCFTCNLLWGEEFILSPLFLSSLSSEKSRIILKDYERFMNETAQKPLHVKLQAVNFYINGLVGVYDEQGYAKEDYWASRGEFLKNGGGDCEDYAIAKYYTLKDFGLLDEQMALCIVKEKFSGFFHAILLVYPEAQKEPLVLDNLSFKLLPLNKRTDLQIKECMNENGYFLPKKEGNFLILQKNHPENKSFRSMLERNSTEKVWRKDTK